MAKELHPLVKAAGFKSEKAFYDAFPTQAHYEAHMRNGGKMQMGGYNQVQGNYTPNSGTAGDTPGTQGRMSSGVFPTPAQVNPFSGFMGLFSGQKPQAAGAPKMAQPLRIDAPAPQGAPANNAGWTGAPLASSSDKGDYGCADDLNNYTPTEIAPQYADGGYTQKPGWHWDGEKMVKSKGSTYNAATGAFFQTGGNTDKTNYWTDPQGNINGFDKGKMQILPTNDTLISYEHQRPDINEKFVYNSGHPNMSALIRNGAYGLAPTDSVNYYKDLAMQTAGVKKFQEGGVHMYTEKQMQEVPNNEYGGMTNGEMKHGGIHINPANRGKFNATKKATGKTTEELTHSTNPITKKRAIFAQNASHWNKKEYGGTTNPFNSLSELVFGGVPPMYQDGGGADASDTYSSTNFGMKKVPTKAGVAVTDNETSDQLFADSGIQQQPQQPQQPQNYATADIVPNVTSPAENAGLDTPVDNSAWQQGLTPPQQQQAQLMDHTTSPGTYAPKSQQHRDNNYGNMLGTGLAIAGAAEQYKANMDSARYANSRSSDNLPGIVNYRGHGMQDTQGFTPGTYAQTPGFAKVGGMFQDGGATDEPQYTKGQTLDLSKEEIDALIRKGYKLSKA